MTSSVEGFPSFLAVKDDNNIPALVSIQDSRGRSAFPAAEQAADQGVPVVSFWSPPQRYDVSLLLQFLSGGPPCVRITALDCFSDGTPAPTSGRTFTTLHEECSSKNKAAVMPLDNGYEILLAAGRSDSESSKDLIFEGYLVSAGAPLVVGEAIGNSRMHLVLDLDETLISAQAMSGLRDRMESLTRKRLAAGDDAAELLSLEQDLLQHDIDMLRQFTDSDTVEHNGHEHEASMETAVDDNGDTIQRPVIRLHDLGVVFTRIDPYRPDTSMIMRIRAGWEGLRSYLCLMDTPIGDPRTAGKLRCDVFVATAAERGYALEAWRLLDPEARLIPQQRVARRVVCIPGSRQKKLEKVFNLKDSRNSVPDGPSPMPTAIIIDDRPEVWEPSQRPQVISPAPFLPLREMAAALEGLQKPVTGPLPLAMWASSTELDRCNTMIAAVRSSIFFHLNQASNPEGQEEGIALPTVKGLIQAQVDQQASMQDNFDPAIYQQQQQQQPTEGPDLTPRDPRLNLQLPVLAQGLDLTPHEAHKELVPHGNGAPQLHQPQPQLLPGNVMKQNISEHGQQLPQNIQQQHFGRFLGASQMLQPDGQQSLQGLRQIFQQQQQQQMMMMMQTGRPPPPPPRSDNIPTLMGQNPPPPPPRPGNPIQQQRMQQLQLHQGMGHHLQDSRMAMNPMGRTGMMNTAPQQQKALNQQLPPQPRQNVNAGLKRPAPLEMSEGFMNSNSNGWQVSAKVARQDNGGLGLPSNGGMMSLKNTLAASASAATAAGSQNPGMPVFNRTASSGGQQLAQASSGSGNARQTTAVNCVSLLNTQGHRLKKQVNYSEQSKTIAGDGGMSMQGWHVEVKVGGERAGIGESKSKKEAKLRAAFNALENLNLPRPLTWSDSIPMPSA